MRRSNVLTEPSPSVIVPVQIFEWHTKTSLFQVFVCDDGKKLYNIDDCLTDASELVDRRSNKNSLDGIRSSNRWTGEIILQKSK
jgi:hypothetical protein